MQTLQMTRAYESSGLPLEERLPSLARRFPSLVDANGLEPWAPGELHDWLVAQPGDSAARHSALLLLSLWGEGEWPPFNVVEALASWDAEHKLIFSRWARCWKA